MHRHERHNKFLMHFDGDTKTRIQTQLTRYTNSLARLVKQTKPGPRCQSDIHNTYFAKFGELLCYRDELNAFLHSRDGNNSKSILETPALDSYEAVFDFLSSSEIPVTSLSGSPESDHTLRISEDVRGLCRLGLWTFGTKSTRASSDNHTWKRIQETYFPYTNSSALRIAFYNSENRKSDDSVLMPKRWTREEDYQIVSGVMSKGRGLHGIHHMYIALREMRSFDEIVERIAVFFPEPQRKYKKQTLKGTAVIAKPADDPPSDNSDEWSIDDSLLVL